ncbi:unnamed protein product [Brachionus calyciflorus]|uniref:Doublecortin domain-containing protein n=1 Tax=Brachionus calyciflorus TaxID=104777 RepID=A0A813SFM0_9BILA|nr:unnamed protein product [Brachionus calyciflorus]
MSHTCHLGEYSTLNFNPKYNNTSKEYTYEDILIGKYLEDLRQIENKPKLNKKSELESPYLQKLTSSNLPQTLGNRTQPNTNQNIKFRTNSALGSRPNSALNLNKYAPYMTAPNNRPGSKLINLDDTSFVNSTNNMPNIKIRSRPSSAPIKRSTSKQSFGLSSGRSRTFYKNQPFMIKAVAYRNGSSDICATIAARNLNEFLQIATERLQLGRAARRVFLDNGDEIRNENQFLKNASVYVSCGEEFNDPFIKTKNFLDKRKSAIWTAEGLQFIDPEEHREFQKEFENKKNNETKAISKFEKTDRFAKKTRLTKRLVVYANGTEFNPAIVVLEYVNPAIRHKLTEKEIGKLEKDYFEDFLDECTNRVNLHGMAKCVFNWNGHVVRTIEDVPVLDKCLQSLVNEVEYAPVWVSKGEGFDSRGVIFFLENLIKFTKKNRRELVQKKRKLQKKLETLNKDPNHDKNLSFRTLEVNVSLKDTNKVISDLESSISNLDEILSNLKTMSQENLFSHIKKLTTEEKIFGGKASKGVKLTVRVNGSNTSFDVFFNTKDWKNSQETQLYHLLEEINRIYQKQFGYVNKFTRLFSEEGDEIKMISKLTDRDVIWVSQGENWKGELDAIMAVSINFLSIVSMKTDGQNLNFVNQSLPEPKNNNESENDEIPEGTSSDSDLDDDLKNIFKKNFKPKKKPQNELYSSYEPQINTNIKVYSQSINSALLKKFDKSEFWDIFTDNNSLEILQDLAKESNSITSSDDLSEIDLNKVIKILIQCTQDEKIMLYPKLKISKKNQRNSTKMDSVWFHDFQAWKFNKSGNIYNQFFPKLCLCIDTSKPVQLELVIRTKSESKSKKQQEIQTETIIKKGFAVVLGLRSSNEPKNDYKDTNQQWAFNKHGNILTKALNEQMVLTSADNLLKEINCVSVQTGNLEKHELKVSDPSTGSYVDLNPDEIGLFVLEKFETNTFSSSQRWAIKQQNSRSIGEWRYSELSTALWHKLAYTWPVDHKEKLIENFTWPLCGYLISGAPPLKNVKENSNENLIVRLRVLKNGCIDLNTAISLARSSSKHFNKDSFHCANLTPAQFEFNSFLNACTNTLGLPNAARRLFDLKGLEHYDLTKLKSEEYVYVSCGEAWIDPKQARDEQDKKIALNNLADDLNKILYFIKLKSCRNFVIETNSLSIQDGTKLNIGTCCLNISQIERIKQGESIQNVIEIENKEDESNEEEKIKTAHDKSHERMDAVFSQKFRWPWEVVINKSMEGVFEKKNDDPDADLENKQDGDVRNSIDQQLSDRFKPKPRKSVKNRKLSSQKFAYNKTNGFIYNIDNPNYVFGVQDVENNQSEVILMKRNEDNINQRWTYRPDGTIALKARSTLVLTVKLPPIETSDIDINLLDTDPYFMQKSIILGSQITVQQLIDFENGNSHQKWFIDEDIGFIYSFATSDENIEITAANKAGICTNYVCYDKEISQNGYCCEFLGETKKDTQGNILAPKVEKNLVCISCAKATRGKFRLTKLSNKKNFSCFIGKTIEKSFKEYDGFKFLHEKVDLSSGEIENTFSNWYSKLLQWRKESNAKTVLNELSSYKNINIIKIIAYKNGDGWTRPGELIISSTLNGLLEQATSRLQLNNAARRLYTHDGTLILDVHDLITWLIDFYRKQLYKNEPVKTDQSKTSSNEKSDDSKLKESKSLLDRVNFNEENFKDNSLLKNFNDATPSVRNSKPITGPTKNDIRRILNYYDRTSKVDTKKLLKWPVEIWVSCGEQFIPPKLKTKIENEKMVQREQVDKAEHELEIQSHMLRQMTGRRFNNLNYGQYKSVKNPDFPVIREGHWSEVPYEEQIKQEEVNKLKNFVDEIKNPNKKSTKPPKASNLYGNHPITKRMLIYTNGDSPEKAIHCWASNIDELNETAKIKLNITKPIKFFYTKDGKIISRFEDIVRDQLVCVSTGREFIPPDQRNKEVELKANWNRVKREEGFEATNLKVTVMRNPVIDVDPFGPPLLTNTKKKPVLALPAPNENSSELKTKKEIQIEEIKKELNENRKKSQEKLDSPKRPSTGTPNTKTRKPKAKSKSPKRVHISNDPKDLPTLNQQNNLIENNSKDDLYMDDSFFNDDDVLNILD